MYYFEFKAQKDKSVYKLSYISEQEDYDLAILENLKSEGYTDIEMVTARKKKSKDKEEIKLIKVIPDLYEVSFKIKLQDKDTGACTKYKKVFLVESTDEKKVPEILTQRCHKEFSRIRSINHISYKLADENSKESSEIVEEIRNKVNISQSENDSEVNLNSKEPEENNSDDSLLAKLNRLAERIKSGNISIGFDGDFVKDAMADYNLIKNCRVGVDENHKAVRLEPQGLMIFNQKEFDTYRMFLDIDNKNGKIQRLGPIDVIAKSHVQALSMFLLIDQEKMPNYLTRRNLMNKDVNCTVMRLSDNEIKGFPEPLIHILIYLLEDKEV